jgi:hypothetical protein
LLSYWQDNQDDLLDQRSLIADRALHLLLHLNIHLLISVHQLERSSLIYSLVAMLLMDFPNWNFANPNMIRSSCFSSGLIYYLGLHEILETSLSLA